MKKGKIVRRKYKNLPGNQHWLVDNTLSGENIVELETNWRLRGCTIESGLAMFANLNPIKDNSVSEFEVSISGASIPIGNIEALFVEDVQNKQLFLLKESQWEKAIKNEDVKTGRVFDYEVIYNSSHNLSKYAKVVLNEKKVLVTIDKLEDIIHHMIMDNLMHFTDGISFEDQIKIRTKVKEQLSYIL